MGSLTSVLTLRLVDQVTGPAAKAAKSIKGLDADARRASGVKGGLLAAGGRAGGLAALGGRTLLTGAAVAGGAKIVKDAVTDFAALDRRMSYVGLTADATAEQTRRATLELRRMAQMPGSPGLDKTVEGLESLVASGRALPEAMSFLPAVTRTAVAANASVEDIATSADALASHFKISGEQMQGAFDTLVAGGKLGKFELKDMARYLPSLGPAAAAVGFKGAEGLKRFVAVLQTIRAGTGTAEEAATAAGNVFQKMESEETVKKFSKFGIDLRKEMARARKEGKDLFETFIQLSGRALKGDISKLPQLFTDVQVANGMRALMTMPDLMRQFNAALKNVDGSTMKDFARVAGDAQDKLDRLSAVFNDLQLQLGDAAAPAATGFMHRLQLEIRQVQAHLEDLAAWFQHNTGMTPAEAALKLGNFGGETDADMKARLDREDEERRNPLLRDERAARGRYEKLGGSVAALSARAGKIDPRRATTGEMAVLGNLRVAQEELDAAVNAYLEAGRRARQAEFAAPGPATAEDMVGVGSIGPLKGALNMQTEAANAGATAMAAFTSAMEQQMAQTLALADRFVAQLQAKLSFTASPTIAPNVVAPAGGGAPAGGAPGKQSRALTGSDARRIVRFEGDRMYKSTGLA
ncbi:phage tail tape measure protein [Xanthobacter tagetidis]|uniref:Phage tail tape measure protein n=1 Tax=Xanthobacter tagetidis TaxID=60216 RepID=A0A3L7AK00_9HYPH|nr:phage tail tape measure protein [Xanthobacter tagetidis]MBB6308901.1 TP901 family phage tail tape measure protein [Xanthobacter tagetidis]RLP80587.1 phage tail tape measure protein [Xanthobacter tagetidis]